MVDKPKETSEAFEAYVGSIVNGGFINMALSIGLETGLLQVMCEVEGAKTSLQIADIAGLKERYVREWLGAMATAGIVDVVHETYRIPPHRIAALKPDGNNMMINSRAIMMLSSVYKDLIECFKKDGPRGISYSRYTDFHGVMAGFSRPWCDQHLIQDFVPSIEGLKEKLESGIHILDVGCGKGRSTHLFAKHYPNSQVYGLDFSQECITHAKKMATDDGITNIHFVCQDAAHMDSKWNNKFYYVFISDALHDQAYPDKVLGEISRVLKSDGLLSLLEPESHSKLADNVRSGGKAPLYVMSLMNCVPVSLNFEGGMGLGAMWGQERATEFLLECGFETLLNTPSGGQMHYLCRMK